eukprot:1615838-Amphidinium_carterae.2
MLVACQSLLKRNASEHLGEGRHVCLRQVCPNSRPSSEDHSQNQVASEIGAAGHDDSQTTALTCALSPLVVTTCCLAWRSSDTCCGRRQM